MLEFEPAGQKLPALHWPSPVTTAAPPLQKYPGAHAPVPALLIEPSAQKRPGAHSPVGADRPVVAQYAPPPHTRAAPLPAAHSAPTGHATCEDDDEPAGQK